MLNQKQQGRLDGFFKVTPKEKTASTSAKGAKDNKKSTGKRKVCAEELDQRWKLYLSTVCLQADEKEKPGAKKAKGKK
jgi:hypothetical protein